MKLLFISDSDRLRDDPPLGPDGKAPIAELFDDERWRLLRLWGQAHHQVRMVVISAQYGLVNPGFLARPYRRSLGYERVDEVMPVLRRQWTGSIEAWLEGIDDIHVAAVDAHRYVLQRLGFAIDILPRMRTVLYAVAGLGYQSQQLMDWLHE